MANNFFKVKKGLKIEPNTVAGTEAGDIRVDSAASNKPKYFNGSSEDIIPTAASTDTLTNKTIVASSNTITTVASGNLTSVELNAALAELQSDVDTRALSSDLSTHISDTTTHGTTGDIVGTSDSQTLSNKSIDADQNTITNIENADIKAGAAIARSKLADGTADHVLINSAAGAMSSEATLAKSRGGAGADMSSVTFPSTGTIVTRAAAEDLSNKTFTDPVTLQEQTGTPTTPSSGDRKLYAKDDGKLYHLGADGVEKAVGSGAGGGINYHADYECDDITKVVEYDDGAATPTDGTGGTVNYASSSLEETTPLSGDASYKLSKSANSAQGEGWAIDSDSLSYMETNGQAIWVDFSYKTSANFVADDIKVYVYRVGSNTLEALNTFQGRAMSNSLPVAPNGGRYTGWVTCSSSDTSLRLILHCASTSALAYDIYVDRLSMGPSAQVQAGIIGDLEEVTGYTLSTGTGSISNATLTTFEARRGDSILVVWSIAFTGTSTWSDLYLNMRSGRTIDVNKLTQVGSDAIPSQIRPLDAGVAGYGPGIFELSTSTQIRFIQASGGIFSSTSPFTFNSTDSLSGWFEVPISGWTSGNVMSTAELQVRTTLVDARNTSGQTITTTTETIVTGWTEVIDDVGVFDASAGVFTAPYSGSFTTSFNWLFNTTMTTRTLGAIKHYQSDGTTLIRDYAGTGPVISPESAGSISKTIRMNKGEKLKFSVYHAEGSNRTLYSADSRYITLTIFAEPDLTVIGVTGVNANARYTTTAGQSVSNATLTIIDFGTKDFDSHSAVTTGASWKYTAPVSGKYRVSANITTTSTGSFSAAEYIECRLYKNGSLHAGKIHSDYNGSSSNKSVQIDTLVSLNTGDYIDIREYQTSGGAMPLESTAGYNWIDVEYIGN